MKNRKTDALISGSAAPETYMEIKDERQVPQMGSCRDLLWTVNY